MILLSGFAATAHADSLGIGAAIVRDLPDAVETAVPTEFGFGGALLLPLRLDLAPAAALRATARFDVARGSDHVVWQLGDSEVGEAPRWALFLSSAATVGPEVRFATEGRFRPYVAGELGAALVHTFHDIERAELLDPAKNNVTSTGNLDPYSRQLALATDVSLGAHADPVWFELGYTDVFVDEAKLLRSTPELQVRRAPYGWNALRLAVGVSVPLGG